MRSASLSIMNPSPSESLAVAERTAPSPMAGPRGNLPSPPAQLLQAIVGKDYDKPDWRSSLVSVRGLGASEYLLFHPEADNGCAASVSNSWLWRSGLFR